MSVRTWGLVASVISFLLLAWVAVLSLGPESIVVPSVHVSARNASAGTGAGQSSGTAAPTSAERSLAERTRLQAESSVASGASSLAIGSQGERLVMTPGVANGRATVRDWLSQKPDGLLQQPEFRTGVASLPYREANVLVQPQGRTFRRAHNDQVRYGGGWIIFGMCLALALFLLGRGRIRTVEGESGETVLRFNAFERGNHWMTAGAFIIMAVTGLVILYGKPLLLPLIGAGPFSSLARASAWVHMASAVPFVLGLLLMLVLWVGGNLPARLDWEWLKRGGGFLRDDGDNPPARRFNAGQKLMFWGAILGGAALTATGLSMMFPFYWLGYTGMQWAQVLHASIALAMVALIIGHIYIGTVGMQGAIDAMWSGRVDRNWAREHHSLWLRELDRGDPEGRTGWLRRRPR